VGVTALWIGSRSARYGFYDRKHHCEKAGSFRFGSTCRSCSTSKCPDGQFRIGCGGGSDSYCASCTNVCLQFKDAADSSSFPLGVCLEDAQADTPIDSAAGCDPVTQGSRCAYTSEGSPRESNCQIETCCNFFCTSDEEASAAGQGTVCPASREGLEEDMAVEIRFDGETPGYLDFFNANSNAFKAAVAGAAGVAVDKVSMLWANGPSGTDSAADDASALGRTANCSRAVSDSRGTAETPIPQGFEEPYGAGRASLPGEERITFGIKVETTAYKLDSTWAQLTEDSLNRELAKRCLQPVIMLEASDPSEISDADGSNVSITDSILSILLPCVLGSIFGICICVRLFKCMRTSKVNITDTASIWTKYEWGQLPVQYRQHWEILGWNRMNWDEEEGSSAAFSEDMQWAQLPPRVQASAIALGYSADMWDSGEPVLYLPLMPPPHQAGPAATYLPAAIPTAFHHRPAPPPYGGKSDGEGGGGGGGFCHNCGTQKAAGARFCTSCGTKT